MSEIRDAFWRGFANGAAKAAIVMLWPFLVCFTLFCVAALALAAWPLVPFARLVRDGDSWQMEFRRDDEQ